VRFCKYRNAADLLPTFCYARKNRCASRYITNVPNRPRLIIGLLAGISRFIGVGGGVLIVPALVLLFGSINISQSEPRSARCFLQSEFSARTSTTSMAI